MAYTHLTMDELAWIETYYHQSIKPAEIAKRLSRAVQTVYNVVNVLKKGKTVQDYYDQYTRNKKRCGRRKKRLSSEDIDYIKRRVNDGWTPDTLIGRNERPLNVSVKTLYRRFQDDDRLQVETLPMKGKRKPNHHKERRGKQAFRRSIEERNTRYPHFKEEFGHLEGDTIVGKDHQSCAITLVERVSKCIMTLKPKGRRAKDIEERLDQWLRQLPKHLFKSLIFDCGKEFSNWKTLSNDHDIDIFFADPGTPSQRGLNEHSNGLLRRDGLPKQTDFNLVSESFIQAVAHRRNSIPRKSLNYQTPLEVLTENIVGYLF